MEREAQAVVHISGQNLDKRDQVVRILNKTLRDHGNATVTLCEQQIRDTLAITDDDLLARITNWVVGLLSQNATFVLISTDSILCERLISLANYSPLLELATDQEFITSAPQRVYITGEASKLPEEIAHAVLILETIVIASQTDTPTSSLHDEGVYSAEEEALLEEHLKSLGYM